MIPTIAITVLLPGQYHFEIPAKWTLEIPAMPREKAADLVFAMSNMPPEFMAPDAMEILKKFPRDGFRSVSNGDTLIIGDATIPGVRHICTVAGTGFVFH